jgi:hypothetical protein
VISTRLRVVFNSKIAICGQNFERRKASTIRPKAKSLSAMHAAGVGQPGLVPLV